MIQIYFNVTEGEFVHVIFLPNLRAMILLEESWRIRSRERANILFHPNGIREMEVEVYILLCRISIKYTGRADIVGQYRPGSQVQQPIPGCALKPRPLFRGCISHISRAVFKSRWNTQFLPPSFAMGEEKNREAMPSLYGRRGVESGDDGFYIICRCMSSLN